MAQQRKALSCHPARWPEFHPQNPRRKGRSHSQKLPSLPHACCGTRVHTNTCTRTHTKFSKQQKKLLIFWLYKIRVNSLKGPLMGIACLWVFLVIIHSPISSVKLRNILRFPFRILSCGHHPSRGPKHRGPGAAAFFQLSCCSKPQSEILPHRGLEHRLAWRLHLRRDHVWIPAFL